MKLYFYLLFILTIILGCSISQQLLVETKREVWKMHPDGSDKVKITDNGQYPKWIPKVKDKIAFARFQGNYNKAAIFITDTDGNNPVQLTDFNTFGDFSWSPERNWIVFSSDQHGNREIYKVNINTKQQIRLTNNQAVDQKPKWSPKGDKIAFESNRRDNMGFDIWVMNINGAVLKNLTHYPNIIGGGLYAVWAPDGEAIVYHGSYIGLGSSGDRIYWSKINTPTSTPTIVSISNQKVNVSIEPLWNPEGDFLFYVSDQNGLYKRNMKTGQEDLLVNLTSTLSATSYMDANETTIFFVKGFDLYTIQWRYIGNEQILVEGYNPDVW